jgi:hypothetical protein
MDFDQPRDWEARPDQTQTQHLDNDEHPAIRLKGHTYQFHVRTDHQLTSKDAVSARVSWNLNDQIYLIDRFGGPYIPGFTLPNPERTANGTVGYFHTFSSAIVNEARLGVNRRSNSLANGDSRNAAQFGLPNGTNANGIPYISVSGGGLASLGGLQWYNRDQNELTVYESDSKRGSDFRSCDFQENPSGAKNWPRRQN